MIAASTRRWVSRGGLDSSFLLRSDIGRFDGFLALPAVILNIAVIV